MFYCDPCAERHEWPHPTLFRSLGLCEMCDTRKVCNETPSKELPPSKFHPANQKVASQAQQVIKAHPMPQSAQIGSLVGDSTLKINPSGPFRMVADLPDISIRKPPCGVLAPCVVNGNAVASCQLDRGHDEGPEATLHEFRLRW